MASPDFLFTTPYHPEPPMTRPITLAEANAIVEVTLTKAAELKLKPLTVAVLDAGGHLKALARQDDTSTPRPEVAQGKARGATSLRMGSRAIFHPPQEQPFFIQAISGLPRGSPLPVPGGAVGRHAGGRTVARGGRPGHPPHNHTTPPQTRH